MHVVTPTAIVIYHMHPICIPYACSLSSLERVGVSLVHMTWWVDQLRLPDLPEVAHSLPSKSQKHGARYCTYMWAEPRWKAAPNAPHAGTWS